MPVLYRLKIVIISNKSSNWMNWKSYLPLPIYPDWNSSIKVHWYHTQVMGMKQIHKSKLTKFINIVKFIQDHDCLSTAHVSNVHGICVTRKQWLHTVSQTNPRHSIRMTATSLHFVMKCSHEKTELAVTDCLGVLPKLIQDSKSDNNSPMSDFCWISIGLFFYERHGFTCWKAPSSPMHKDIPYAMHHAERSAVVLIE